MVRVITDILYNDNDIDFLKNSIAVFDVQPQPLRGLQRGVVHVEPHSVEQADLAR